MVTRRTSTRTAQRSATAQAPQQERGTRAAPAKPRGGSTRRRFEYKPRSQTQVSRRANQSSGNFDSYIQDDVETWTPDAGDRTIRILPPTWDDPDDFAFDIFVHYGIGTDEQAYLCRSAMLNEDCPICDERATAIANGDEEYAKELAATKRCVAWIIDRDKEKEGPKIWAMPVTVNKGINKIVIDKRTGEVLPIDDPENGYDIEFTREGTGLKTKYTAIMVSHHPSPLHDDDAMFDKWIGVALDNPVPDLLVYHDYDYVLRVFNGGSGGGGQPSQDEGEELPDGLDPGQPDQPPLEEEDVFVDDPPWSDQELDDPEPEPEPEPESEPARPTRPARTAGSVTADDARARLAKVRAKRSGTGQTRRRL